MTDIQAAMGRVALERYPADLAYRAQLADRYDERLTALGLVELPSAVAPCVRLPITSTSFS